MGLGASVALAFAVNALAARLVDPEGFGLFVVLVTASQAVAVLAELGLPPLMNKYLARGDRPGIARTGAVAVGVSSAAIAVAIWGLVEILDNLGPIDVAPAFAVAGLLVFARAGERMVGDMFRGLHLIPQAIVFGLLWLQAGASMAFLVALLTVSNVTTTGLVVLYGAAGTCGIALAAWLLRSELQVRPPGALRTLRSLLRESWAIMGHRGMMIVMQSADIWVVAILLSSRDTALYGAAARVVMAISIPLVAINQVVPPLIARLGSSRDHEQRRRLERTLRVSASLAGLPAALGLLGLLLAGRPLLGLTFGDFYRDAAVPLAILGVGQLANVWAGSCGIVLTQTGHQRLLFTVSVSAGLFKVVGVVIAAVLGGPVLVAVVAAFAVLLQNVLMASAVHRRLGIRTTVGLRHAVDGVKALRGRS